MIHDLKQMMYHFEVDVSYSHLEEEESDDAYRTCFLKAFGMDEYDDSHWRNVFEELFSVVFPSPLFRRLFERVSSKIGIPIYPEKQRDSYEICFIFLLNYTYFEKTHRVLRDFANQQLDEQTLSYQDLLTYMEKCE